MPDFRHSTLLQYEVVGHMAHGSRPADVNKDTVSKHNEALLKFKFSPESHVRFTLSFLMIREHSIQTMHCCLKYNYREVIPLYMSANA